MKKTSVKFGIVGSDIIFCMFLADIKLQKYKVNSEGRSSNTCINEVIVQIEGDPPAPDIVFVTCSAVRSFSFTQHHFYIADLIIQQTQKL